MTYTPTNWVNGVTTLGPTNMNKIENGVFSAGNGVFNVMDTAYGATGNGVADDTSAIQAAIDACQTANGGIVFLPPGIYKISSPLLITQHHVTLEGAGMGVASVPTGGQRGPTVLYPTSAGSFTGSAVIRVGQSGSPTSALVGVCLRRFAIAGFSLASNVEGVYAEIQNSLITELRIENPTSHGIHLKCVVAADACFNDIFHNVIENPGGCGIQMGDAPDNRITDNSILEATSHGIDTSTAAGSMIQNNLISCTGKGVYGAIYDTKVIGNRIEGCNGGVYLIDTIGYGGFQIVGNKLWNCSKATDNTTDSINVTGSTATFGAGVISGNAFWTNEASGGTPPCHRARYHINIASSNVQQAVISGNSYGYNNATSSYGTAAINDSGTGTQIDGIRYVAGASKTTVSDSDFMPVPPNGALAVHRDTSANKTYTSVRANGAWTVTAGPL